MSIVKTITNPSEFYHWVKQSDSYKNNFTYEGAKALQAYLDDLSDGMDEPIEFDPIAWCVEWTEYENLDEVLSEFDYAYKTLEDLQDVTTVIEVDGTDRLVVQDF